MNTPLCSFATLFVFVPFVAAQHRSALPEQQHTLRVTFPQTSGLETDAWNGFQIHDAFVLRDWFVGISVEYGEWTLSAPAEQKAFAEGTMISLFAERQRQLDHDWHAMAGAGLGLHLVEVDILANQGDAELQSDGMEFVPQLEAALSWQPGKRFIGEVGVRASLHLPDWKLPGPEGRDIDSYSAITPFAGIGIRF